MEKTIEDLIIEAIKHPWIFVASLLTLVVIVSLVKLAIEKLGWIYRREKFFKQIEMKFFEE